MTERERLIELVLQIYEKRTNLVIYFTEDDAEIIADHLLSSRVIVPPCKVGDTVYAVDIVTQRQGRSKMEIAVAVEFTVDHFEIGQANIPFAIACNKDNVWTHLKPSEIYDKTTAEAIAKVINEIRRDANAAH